MIRLFLIDDHPIVREGLKAFLELADDLEVVAEVGSLEEARASLKTHNADLFLLDIQLGDDISEQNGLNLLSDPLMRNRRIFRNIVRTKSKE